jgi:hypothetical protein
MVLLFLAISFVQRVDLSVAIVAISDNRHANPNFKVIIRGTTFASFRSTPSELFINLPFELAIDRNTSGMNL